jgi:hypothetical protein
MAAGSTYTPIATTTLGSAQASYTFSSISGSYTDLRLVMNIKSTTGFNPWLQFNGDTATNYSYVQVYGDGTTAASNKGTSTTSLYLGEGFNTQFWTYFADVQNYSNSTTYKTTLWRGSIASNYVQQGVSLWRSTSAITSVKVGVSSGNLDVGTSLTLYGIAAA